MRSVAYPQRRLRHNLSHCSSHIAPPRVFSGRDDDFCTVSAWQYVRTVIHLVPQLGNFGLVPQLALADGSGGES